MELADFIRLGRQEPALRFLIIGRYAVAAHGHTRATFDVDFLVRRAEREAWLNRLDLRLPRYEELFLRYGNREIYDTILRLLRNPWCPGGHPVAQPSGGGAMPPGGTAALPPHAADLDTTVGQDYTPAVW